MPNGSILGSTGASGAVQNVRLAGFDVAPAGPGFVTLTVIEPFAGMADGGRAIVTLVGEMKVAGYATPSTKMVPPLTKPVPVTVSVKPSPGPGVSRRLVIVGGASVTATR